VGFSAEQIAPLLTAATATQQAKIDDLAGQLNVSREAVVGFLRTLRVEEVPTERLAEKLALIARRYRSMMERLGALYPEDPEAQQYLDEARKKLEHAGSVGEYEEVDRLLSLAEGAQASTLRRVERNGPTGGSGECLSRGSAGMYTGADAAGLGDDPKQPGQRSLDTGRA
jgi:hypothetical protein